MYAMYGYRMTSVLKLSGYIIIINIFSSNQPLTDISKCANDRAPGVTHAL